VIRTPLIVIALASALVACGQDEPQRAASDPPAGDASRYCAITRELDTQGEQFFAQQLDRDAGPKEYAAAERRFLERFEPTLSELRHVAPPEIRADVGALLAGMQVRAGMEPEPPVTEAEASAAEERLQAWEKRAC
jgi:hypothetical protein